MSSDTEREPNVERKGFRLSSTDPVSLYVSSEYSGDGSADSFLVFPIEALGTRYIALTGDSTVETGSDPSFFNQVNIIALNDKTDVSIRGKSRQNFELNALETATFAASEDLTGTEITGDKPIAVISGSRCGSLPLNGCDFLAEMLPPVESWGRSFPIVNLAGDLQGDYFKIVADNEGTDVFFNGVKTKTLKSREFYTFLNQMTIFSILNASEPVLVMQMGQHLFNYNLGDPLFILVPAETQFSSSTVTIKPTSYYQANTISYVDFMNIIVDAGMRDCIRFDGVGLTSPWFPIPNSNFVVSGVPITADRHVISCTNSTGTFATSFYGYSFFVGYGFLGALSLQSKGLSCLIWT